MFTPHCALNLLWLLKIIDFPQGPQRKIVFILEYLAKVPRHTPYKQIQNRLAGTTRNRRKCYWQHVAGGSRDVATKAHSRRGVAAGGSLQHRRRQPGGHIDAAVVDEYQWYLGAAEKWPPRLTGEAD
jgi:hypothetical protein